MPLEKTTTLIDQQYPLGWADILGEINIRGAGANNPAWAAFRNGIFTYTFSATTMQEAWMTYHIPHTYCLDTPINLHVHWATPTTNTGVVRWGFEYTYGKGYAQGAFPATQTIYKEQAGSGVAYDHMIAETDDLIIPGLEVDGMLLVRVFRDAAHANDTQTAAVHVFTADIHHQIDRVATKNRNFPFYT